MRIGIVGKCVAVVALVGTGLGLGDANAGEADREAAKVELGRRLFLDPLVSGGGKFSCASCHEPEHGFSDPRQFSADENGPTARHSQPVTDLAGEGFHWDGEFYTVRQLLTARLASPRAAVTQARMLLNTHFQKQVRNEREPDRDAFTRRIQSLTPPYYGPVTTPSGPVAAVTPIPDRLQHDGHYARGFLAAYGNPSVTSEGVIDAMDAYLETLRTTKSPHDRYLAGDKSALSDSAKRGRELFVGKASCNECHPAGDSRQRATFSDGKFHNTGVAYRIGKGGKRKDAKDRGHANMTFVADDVAMFKTPSLRDVARRAPYMHDGSMKTLADVVSYYNRGGTANAHLDPHVQRLGLSKAEQADLVAFLESLTGEERAGLGRAHPQRTETLRVAVEDLQGEPMREFAFEVAPFGDRLADAGPHDKAIPARTDRSGLADVGLPGTTHVQLVSPTHELETTHPIPDWVRSVSLIAVPKDTVAVRVKRPQGSSRALPDRISANNVSVLTRKQTAGSFKLRKIRNLSIDEALYAAPAKPRGKVVPVRLTVEYGVKPGRKRNKKVDTWQIIVEIDMGGGMSEPVDLGLGGLSRSNARRSNDSGQSDGATGEDDRRPRPGTSARPDNDKR